MSMQVFHRDLAVCLRDVITDPEVERDNPSTCCSDGPSSC